MPNLPPAGSVWRQPDGVLLRILDEQIRGYVHVEFIRDRRRSNFRNLMPAQWLGEQCTATCIYDPTAPQPDHAAECERLRRENERLKDQVIDNDLMRNELEELRMLKSELGDALGGDVDLWASLVQQRNELRDKLAALATPPQGESQ